MSQGLREHWLPVKGFPNYQVSSLGRVMGPGRQRDKMGRLMRPMVRPTKYKYVALVLNGKARNRLVHRLVLCAFAGYKEYPEWEADHINGNRGDNRLANLRWVTRQQNAAYLATSNKLKGLANHRAKLNNSAVKFIRRNYSFQGKWNTTTLAQKFKVTPATISKVVLGKAWTHV
jgi:HNH endonuclease/NUMOD4 motif